jgi:Zn-dependent protease with chaperone function
MITSILATFGSWLLTYLVHSTILICAAILVQRRLRHRPDLMSGIWRAALVGGVLTATVQLSLGAGAMPIATAQGALFAGIEPAGVEPVAFDPGVVAIHEGEPTAAVGADDSAPGWLVAFGGLGLLGLALGSVAVAVSWMALTRQLRPRQRLTDGPLVAMLTHLRRLGRVRRRVALFVAPGARVPMATGIVRPRIVLPPRAAAQLPSDHQRTMLAHELAHLTRHDPAWRLFALLVKRGLFVQPLNHLVATRMAECAEYVCDDWAARHTRQPLALASCLTEIAGWAGGRTPPVAASAMAATGSPLRGRVERLLAPPRAGRGAPLASIATAAALVGVVAMAPSVTHGQAPTPVVVHLATPVAFEAADADAEVRTTSGSARRDRAARRRVSKANRRARRQLDRAMRAARKDGHATPSSAEVEGILRGARAEADARAKAPPPRRAEPTTRSVVVRSGSGAVRIEIHEEQTPSRSRQLVWVTPPQPPAPPRVPHVAHIAPPAPPAPPRPPGHMKNPFAGAPATAPPRPPGHMKNPFAGAPAAASPARGHTKNPFARPVPVAPPRRPARGGRATAPTPPSPPDISWQ